MADDEIDVRRLRSALEFAILTAREGQKVRPQIRTPRELGKYVKAGRLPRSWLPAVRRIVEANDDFRELLATRATPALVDEVGLLWLQRPPGWETAIREAVAAVAETEQEAGWAVRIKQAERKRSAAERAAVRATAELAARDARIAELEAERDFLSDEVIARDELVSATRADLAAAKVEARHARDRERAAHDRAEQLAKEVGRLADAGLNHDDGSTVADARAGAGQAAVSAQTAVGADSTEALSAVDAEELAAVAAAATELAARLVSLSGDTDGEDDGDIEDQHNTSDNNSTGEAQPPRRPKRRRRPLPMPGGVMGDSARATRFLLESGGTVIVDGYNVAKLAWPELALDQQRDRLISATEYLTRRWGTEITIAFDGADICGAHTTRRTTVRVVYSDADQIADDWIRDEVRRLPVSRAVTVVTNDRAVQRDVYAMGANVLSSDQLVAAFG